MFSNFLHLILVICLILNVYILQSVVDISPPDDMRRIFNEVVAAIDDEPLFGEAVRTAMDLVEGNGDVDVQSPYNWEDHQQSGDNASLNDSRESSVLSIAYRTPSSMNIGNFLFICLYCVNKFFLRS